MRYRDTITKRFVKTNGGYVKYQTMISNGEKIAGIMLLDFPELGAPLITTN